MTNITKRPNGWYDVEVDGQVIGSTGRRKVRRRPPLWDAKPRCRPDEAPGSCTALLNYRTREQAIAALVRRWEQSREAA